MSHIHCRIIAFLLLIHYFTLWPWPFTLNICSVSSVTWWISVPNLNAVKQFVAELLRFNCLTLWLWTCFKCCAGLLDSFHQVWPSTAYPCLTELWRFLMLGRYVKLWPWPLTFDVLTLKVRSTSSVTWSKSIQNLSEIEHFPAELLIIFVNFCTPYVTPWRWSLTSWPWTFTALLVSCVQTLYKIWAKSNNPRLSYRRFSAFLRAILGVGQNWESFLRGAWTQLHQTWPEHHRTSSVRSSQHCTSVSEFGYLPHF